MRSPLSLPLVLATLAALLARPAGVSATASPAQAGAIQPNPALDPTFGEGGLVIYTPEGYTPAWFEYSSVHLLPQGEILAGLNFTYAVYKYHFNTSQYVRFSPAGTLEGVLTKGNGRIAAVQSGGRFLITDTNRNPSPIERHFSDLSLDPTFAITGSLPAAPGWYDDFLVQPDDKILVGLDWEDRIYRLLPDGAADQFFPVLGPVTDFRNLVGHPDGRFLVLTDPWADPERNCTATLYSQEGAPLVIVYSIYRNQPVTPCVYNPRQIAPHPDGGFVWVKWVGPYFWLYKSRPDGPLDMGFGQGGVAKFSLPLDIEQDGSVSLDLQPLAQPDGKILLAGVVQEKTGGGSRFMLVRYHPDGTPDETNGPGGRRFLDLPLGSLTTVLLQPDGKLLLAGGAFAMVRLQPLAEVHLTYFPFIGSKAVEYLP